jgi:hypothetical protein
LWLNKTGGTDEIYLYYGAVPVFSFYAENLGLDYSMEAIEMWGIKFFGQNIDPSKTQYKNYHYWENTRWKDKEYIKNSIRQSFSNNLPDFLWFMLSHIVSDYQTYMEAFSELGYECMVYHWEDARLLKLFKKNYLDDNYSIVTDKDTGLSAHISGVDQIERSLNADGSILLNAVGNDPKIYLTLPKNFNYDNTKEHQILIEFATEYEGILQLFYNDSESTEYVAKKVINFQYMPGNNKVFLVLPENTHLDTLRLDIDNGNVPNDSENNIILSKISLFEAR